MSTPPVKLFRINTGSCNGCDVEFVATAFVDKFKISTMGVELVENVEESNLLVITGPLTAKSESFLKKYISKLKKPYAVVGVGTCSVTCGIFRDSYSINGPIDKFVDVSVNVAGCPPRPESIAEGIAKGIKILELKAEGKEIPNVIDQILTGFEAPQKFRGRMELNKNICTACRTCETVCPSTAIKITKTQNGFAHNIWHNSCCYCGNCAYFCPTGAIYSSNSFDTVKLQNEKFSDTNSETINLSTCSSCNQPYMPPSSTLLKRAYLYDNGKKLNKTICSKCRKEENFKRMYA